MVERSEWHSLRSQAPWSTSEVSQVWKWREKNDCTWIFNRNCSWQRVELNTSRLQPGSNFSNWTACISAYQMETGIPSAVLIIPFCQTRLACFSRCSLKSWSRGTSVTSRQEEKHFHSMCLRSWLYRYPRDRCHLWEEQDRVDRSVGNSNERNVRRSSWCTAWLQCLPSPSVERRSWTN